MKAVKIPLIKLNYNENEIDWLMQRWTAILRSGQLTMHNNVHEFESLFAKWNKSEYAIATNSGTSSLEIPLRAIGVEGTVVLCPSNTYMATPLAALHAGAKVCFVDTDVDTLQISIESLTRTLESVENVKVLILVHIAGNISEDVYKIVNLCEERGIKIVEDAAHAHGAEFNGSRAGNFGIAGSFSFYPTKVLNAAEGGMIVTHDTSVFELSLSLREHGKVDSRYNIHKNLGYNWRFSEFHAALGIQQVLKADEILKERRELADNYVNLLRQSPLPLEPMRVGRGVNPSYYKFVVNLDSSYDRNTIKTRIFSDYGVALSGEVYANPCHLQPLFVDRPDLVATFKDQDLSGAGLVARRHLCLPLYPGLTYADQVYVIESLHKVINE